MRARRVCGLGLSRANLRAPERCSAVRPALSAYWWQAAVVYRLRCWRNRGLETHGSRPQ